MSLSRIERLRIKTTTGVAIDAVGNEETCAAINGRIERRQAFNEYRDDGDERHFIPFDVAAALDRYLSRNGKPLAFLPLHADLLGYVVVQRRPAASRTGVETLVAAAETSAHAVATAWSAHADGIWTAKERRDVLAHIDAAESDFEALRQWLREQEDTDG